MKKFVFGFLACFTLITCSVLSYVGHLLYVAKPGFVVSQEASTLSLEQKTETFTALIALSELASVLSLENYSALFLGSAGVLAKDLGFTKMESKHILSRAIVFAKVYGDRTGDLNPFLESRFTLALHLKDIGDLDSAREVASQSLAFDREKYPQSHWVKNFEVLSKRL